MDLSDEFLAVFAERLESVKGQPDECWIWTGPKHTFGYGRVAHKGAWSTTHRASWALANGPIPKGMFVRHSCANPPCVNPAHLSIGTARDNVVDMVEHASQRAGEGPLAGRIPWPPREQWASLRQRYMYTQKEVAEYVGVTAETIGMWETGRATPLGAPARKYAEVLTEWHKAVS